MNFFRNLKQQVLDGIQVFTISGIICILFYELITNLSTYAWVFGRLWKALSPFVTGIIIAFLLIPLRKWCEKKLFSKLKVTDKTRRVLSVIVCAAATIVVVGGFFWILIPQLLSSITSFAESFNTYVESGKELLNNLAESELAPVVEGANHLLDKLSVYVREWLTNDLGGLGQIAKTAVNISKSIVNIFVGFVIAIILLNDSETFELQLNELNYSILPESAADTVVYIARLNKDMFNRFIFGKALDSLIIAVICYICTIILGIPYPVLIAVVIGLTNMIPFFGPFIGAIPCFLILVLIDPIKSLEFAAFIFVLQQIDGNIIGPYILGDSMGLPTLWIMFAILLGGSMFGIPGMVIGVPVFSVIYVIVGDWMHAQLRKKRISLKDK